MKTAILQAHRDYNGRHESLLAHLNHIRHAHLATGDTDKDIIALQMALKIEDANIREAVGLMISELHSNRIKLQKTQELIKGLEQNLIKLIE